MFYHLKAKNQRCVGTVLIYPVFRKLSEKGLITKEKIVTFMHINYLRKLKLLKILFSTLTIKLFKIIHVGGNRRPLYSDLIKHSIYIDKVMSFSVK